MRKNLKWTSLIVIFTIINFLVSCEKDLYEDSIRQQNLKYTYLTGNDAKRVASILESLMLNQNKGKKNRLATDSYGTVLTDVVMQVIDSLGNKTFTFKVDNPDATDKKFFNMVLQQKIDGLTMAKFYEYNMNPEFARKYNNGLEGMQNFQGYYKYSLVSYIYNSNDGGGEEGGGGGGGGNSGGGGSNDGNTGSPTGGSTYDPTSNNTSSGVGGLSGASGGGGAPCPTGGGGVGDGSAGGAGDGGGEGGGSPGNTNSNSNCTRVTISVLCNGGGGHTGEPECTGTNHGYMIQITVCTGGGNKSIVHRDGCGGSGGNSSGTGVFPPTPTPVDPCEQVKKLGDPTKNNIKPNVDVLKNKVNSNDNNNEIGFDSKTNTNFDSTVSYTNTNVVSVKQFNIPITIHSDNIGGGHSHPDGSYPMYSFGDVKLLRDAYNEASAGRKDDVFFILVCKDKNTNTVNTYCLRVDSFGILDSQVDSIWNSSKYADVNVAGDDRINEINSTQSEEYFKSNGDFEKSFLKQFEGFGISVYQATDDSMTKWSKLALNANPNNPITKAPCN